VKVCGKSDLAEGAVFHADRSSNYL
jgi:hypothetical protein